jgi:excinuclease UvrABC nuclease subunit
MFHVLNYESEICGKSHLNEQIPETLSGVFEDLHTPQHTYREFNIHKEISTSQEGLYSMELVITTAP